MRKKPCPLATDTKVCTQVKLGSAKWTTGIPAHGAFHAQNFGYLQQGVSKI